MQGKFSTVEVATLRNDLRQHGFDSFQAAETIKVFVAMHGYGMSAEMARDVASTLENSGFNAECFHQQLERVALVM